MRLYEVNQEIENLFEALEPDPETGEIPANEDEIIAQINTLAMKREDILSYLAKLALDVDSMVLWTLHTHLGFGAKRLHDFYLALAAEHRRMREYYEMDSLYPERRKLKELGADVEQWQKEVEICQ